MQIRFYRALWGMNLPTLDDNLRMIKEGGFDGVEMIVPSSPAERKALRSLLDDLDLDLITQFSTNGQTPAEHLQNFEEKYCWAVELNPRLVNSQTGKDHYTVQENVNILRRAADLERSMGVQVVHEVHRGRATFSLPATMALIDAVPDLRLAADLSHWCCVHESMLQDQADRLERAIQHCHHVHARVGHPEGPQVSDPRAPEWRGAVETHIGWWQRIVDQHKRWGTGVFTITPEFGPPDYMPSLPYTRQPVADLWDVNIYMRDLLREKLTL